MSQLSLRMRMIFKNRCPARVQHRIQLETARFGETTSVATLEGVSERSQL